MEKRRPEGRQWYSQSNGAKFVRYTVKEAPFEMTGLHGIIGKGVVLHDNPDDLGLSENNGNCVYPPKNTLAYIPLVYLTYYKYVFSVCISFDQHLRGACHIINLNVGNM